MKRMYLIRDELGCILEVFDGTSTACQKHIRREYHADGRKVTMSRASRKDLREQKEDCDEV